MTTGASKPLSPHSLSRSAHVPQRDTPDPTSAPIRKVLNAFQGNANSSGTSTKAALDAMRDESGAVPAPSSHPSPGKVAVEMFKEESGAFAVPQRALSEPKSAPIQSVLHAFGGEGKAGASATKDALDYIKEPSSSSIVVSPEASIPSGATSAPTPSAPTPSAPILGAASTPAAKPPRTRAPSEAPPLPAPPLPGAVDATPSPVATEASNSTSPGANSFAEAPSNAGRTDDTEDAVRAALVSSRGTFNIVAFLRTTRGMAIAGGGALLLVIVLVFAFKGSSKPAAKKTPVAAKKADKTEVATAQKPTTDTPPSTDETGNAGTSGTEHVAATGGTTDEQPATGTTDTPTTDTTDTTPTGRTDTTPTTTTPPEQHTPVKTVTGVKTQTGGAAKWGPTIAGKRVVLEYDNQAREAKAVPNNAAQADQSAIAKARQSYAAGNQRLFAGDADGAIRNYKQALAYYPAYVAGYRGLGLAYAQQGNKPAALKALRTYLSSVPGAKDAELIRKRVTTLQGK